MLPNKIKSFICKGCMGVISRPEHFSNISELCIQCYKERKALKNNSCLSCGGKNPEKIYWGVCKKCFNKPIKDKEVEEAMRLQDLERKEGWEAVEDHLDNKKFK